LLFVAGLLLLPGMVGIIIPVLPGIPYMLAIALIFGAASGFKTLGALEIIILTGLAVLSVAIDYLSGTVGAKYGGAKKMSLLLGFIGLIVGLFVLPPFGGVIGLFAGIFLGEILGHRGGKKAVRAATAGVLGAVLGVAINFLLGLVFIGLFIYFAL